MKEYWKTKERKYIDIDEMSVEHLRNTLKMIVRNTRIKNEIMNKTIRSSYVSRGDIASQDFDRALLHEISPDLTCECDEFHTCQQCKECS